MWWVRILKIVLPFIPKIIDRVLDRKERKRCEHSEFNESPMVHLDKMKDLD